MSIRQHTPCDEDDFSCPYNAQNWGDCEYWCGAESEPDYDDVYFDYDTVYVESEEDN